MPFRLQKCVLFLLAFSTSIRGQSTVTVEYPFQVLTLDVIPELLTATIQAHTQSDTILGQIDTNTIPDATYTDKIGKQSVTRTISGSTMTRVKPDMTIVQSIPRKTITRSLWFSTATDTILQQTRTHNLKSGEIPDLYTATGPTFGNSYIYTVIESFDPRRIINTIPGPTLTYMVGDRNPVTATEDGTLMTLYHNPVTVIETLGPTRITRSVNAMKSTRIGTDSLTYTPSSYVSVSVSISTVTVTAPTSHPAPSTIASNSLTSTTPPSTTSNSSTSAAAPTPTTSNNLTSAVAPTAISRDSSKSESGLTTIDLPTSTSKPMKCVPKTKKCIPKPKPTTCN
ncbi:hypothetical protein K7432_003354 [Basidiobolus ranarum]|uniref:Uncharacterized protein n=1 Tax=Basidiobolus ranarum TaxID=34480 RepID=A0ABR2W796_9FUNG